MANKAAENKSTPIKHLVFVIPKYPAFLYWLSPGSLTKDLAWVNDDVIQHYIYW